MGENPASTELDELKYKGNRMTTRADRTRDRVLIEAGSFTMGSDRFYSEERPVRIVHVGCFWIDPPPVTVAQFRAFVEATGYVTLPEIAPDPRKLVGLPPELAQAGPLVFTQPVGPVSLEGRYLVAVRVGADWRHPLGQGSTANDDHPVVHVGHADA